MRKKLAMLGVGVILSAIAVAAAYSISYSGPPPDTENAFLTRISKRSPLILHGKVVSVRSTAEIIAGQEQFYLIAEIEPIEVLRGTAPSSLVEVRDLGGELAKAKGFSFSEQVQFTQGEEVVLFLDWVGRKHVPYLTPIALGRSKFTVISDAGEPFVLNQDEMTSWKRDGSLPSTVRLESRRLQVFLRTVRTLAK